MSRGLGDVYKRQRELAPEMLFKTKYTWEECLDVAKSADLERIKDYQSTLYDKTFLEAMVYGDFDRQDSKKVLSLFKNKTGTRPLNREDASSLFSGLVPVLFLNKLRTFLLSCLSKSPYTIASRKVLS